MKKSVKMVSITFCAFLALASMGASGESSNRKPSVSTATSSNASVSLKSENSEQEQVVAHIGEYSQGEDLKLTFKSAKEYTTVKTENSFSDTKAADGKKIVILNFEAENISKEDQFVSMFYCKGYCDDISIEQKTLLVYPDDMNMLSGELASGKKLKGSIAYEVPKDWKKIEFKYEPIGDTKLLFEVDKKSVEKVN